MAKRDRMIGGHAYTLQMARVNRRCVSQHGMPLRAFLIHWRSQHPFEPTSDLARLLGIDRATLYGWFDRLRLKQGIAFVDLDAEAEKTAQRASLAAASEAVDAWRNGQAEQPAA